LSKNGFDVVLDEKIRDANGFSNMGTAEELATKILEETDWIVDSEAFVEKVNEALVWVTIPKGTNAKHIKD
jgi:hypothetical protein